MTPPGTHGRGLLIDIDAIFDTRLATLEQIDPRVAIYSIERGYESRERDEFYLVNRDVFAEVYATRNYDTLLLARPTRMIELLFSYVRSAILECAMSKSGPPDLWLNTYPYKLTKEQARSFLDPVVEMGGGQANAHVVSWKPDEYPPEVCRKMFATMVMYHYREWMDVHSKSEALVKEKIPNVSLFVPELLHGRDMTPEEIMHVKKAEHGSIFSVHELGAKPFIGLKHFPIITYCANITPEMKAVYRQHIQ